MGADLSFNTSDLYRESERMSSAATRLQNARNSLSANLDTLGDEWVSTAATKFFNKIDVEWADSVQDHIEMLDDLSEALRTAATAYDDLESDGYNAIELS